MVDRYVYIMHDVIKSNGYIIKLKKDTIRTNILHPLSNNSFKIFLYRRKKLATKNIHKTSSSLPSQFPFFTIFSPLKFFELSSQFVLKISNNACEIAKLFDYKADLAESGLFEGKMSRVEMRRLCEFWLNFNHRCSAMKWKETTRGFESDDLSTRDDRRCRLHWFSWRKGVIN